MTATNNNARATATRKAAAAITAKAAKAKAKGPSKAERERINLAKANASAAKALPNVTYEKLILALVEAAKRNDGAARTMAHYMNNIFASEMAAFKCHWSAFTAANCRTDNERAVLERVNSMKADVQELARSKGLANVNKPWSDMKAVSVALFHGGKAPERNPKPLNIIFKEGLTALYKKGMKEERQTDEEARLNIAIGELLAGYFKVDLSSLG
jgi:hypothetical protein